MHTREYAAPEVLASPRRARTTASEIYSLGAVAAFCILGEDPLAATLATDLVAVAAACRVPDPEAFVRHLLAAMATDPARRPRQLRQRSDELVRPAIHSPSPTSPPPARPSSRRLLAAGVSAVAAIALGGAMAHFGWGANAASTPQPTASAPDQPPSNVVTAAPSIRAGSAPWSAPTTTRALTPTGGAPTTTSISAAPPSRPTTATSPPPVVARGSIGSPGPGTAVQTCSYFSGTATVPAGSTLILTKRNLSTGNATVYSELVHGWDKPSALSRWEGAQYFGAGDESSGQSYEVGLRAVPMSAARDFRDGKTDKYGVELAKRGKVLDTVEVDRVEGQSPDYPCEGR